MKTFINPGAGPVDIVLMANAEGVTVPEASLLFRAAFTRDGPDLVLENPGHSDIRIVGYFSAPEPADLVTSDGAVLRGPVVERLAGPEAPGQYAQAGAIQGANPIGQVETINGDGSVQRADGTVENLSLGTLVYENDVVQTGNGATVAITFVDGTIFSLASGSRMLLDELIYDPDGSDNSGVFNLIEGSFVFIAGQAAKTGGMEVNTPTATMGIRGTTVKVDIQTVNGVTEVMVSLNTDPDGGVGSIELRDLDGNLIATITATDTAWVVSPIEGETREIARDPGDLANDADLLSEALTAFQLATQRFGQSGTFITLDGNAGDGPATPPPIEDIGEPPPPPPPPADDLNDGGGDDDSDGGQGGDTVINVNDAPVGTDFVLAMNEDTTARGQLAATDADGDALSFALAQGAASGLVVLQSNGAFTYTPNADFQGTDSFTYTVSDGELTDTRTVTFTVAGVNDAPVAQDVTLTPTGDAIENAGFDDGLQGWSVENTFRVEGATSSSSTSTANLNGSVTALGNAAPAGDDITAASLTIGGSVSSQSTGYGPLLVSSGFTVADGEAISIVYQLDATGGSGDRDAGRMRVYLRDAETDAFVTELFTDSAALGTTQGIETFNGTIAEGGTYELVYEVGSQDSTGGLVIGSVLRVYSVSVEGGVGEGSSRSFDASKFLAGATDVEGDTLSLASVSAFSANGARVSIVGGQVVYDSATLCVDLEAGQTLTDTFTYRISDGNGGFDTATATVTVAGSDSAAGAFFSSDLIETFGAETLLGSGPLDLQNGETDDLTLSAADVFCVSDSDSEDGLFEALEAGIRALRIKGDPDQPQSEQAGDSITLQNEDGLGFVRGAEGDDPAGYNVYDLVQTTGGMSEIIARIAVDEDISVAVAQANVA
ncbi:Ig-like domain-containing protein [Anianabacter salinae]|uniref:Ig-like domain-containing protein n=1 Tax=Anianabacter salinae TaxID=2851023 RepID=UPI00225E4A28|nr:Ig-like domain-containing protein [Anianabacter salinae]MBV0911771.1 tandem-95 repeat protein [Anianabacter salinae]